MKPIVIYRVFKLLSSYIFNHSETRFYSNNKLLSVSWINEIRVFFQGQKEAIKPTINCTGRFSIPL